jgi:hypothetical protein
MPRPSNRFLIILGLGVALSLAAVAVTFPFVEAFQISRVRQQFALDDAVHRELINGGVRKPSAAYVLNPPFMARYNLDADAYLDDEGYFAPDGSDWRNWSLRTKAAAVLMWRGGHSLSTWQIRRTIRLVDDYYARNAADVPVVKVVSATAQL